MKDEKTPGLADRLCGISALASKASAQEIHVRPRNKSIQTADRMLQFSEIQNYRATAFDRLDINASGILEASEIASMQQQTAGRRRGGPADHCRIPMRQIKIEMDLSRATGLSATLHLGC